MNFVKSAVYQQEFTEGGLREREIDTRSREEVEAEERLKKLPEFARDPSFKSYSERFYDGTSVTSESQDKPGSEGKINPNLPAQVTEEEFEFYEALAKQDRRKKIARQREENAMRSEFHKARESQGKVREVIVVAPATVESADVSKVTNSFSVDCLGSPVGSTGLSSPFSGLVGQKISVQEEKPSTEGSLFDVTTKYFQEQKKKRSAESKGPILIKRCKKATTPLPPPSSESADESGNEFSPKANKSVVNSIVKDKALDAKSKSMDSGGLERAINGDDLINILGSAYGYSDSEADE